MDYNAIKYVSDENGNTNEVIIPVELWREIQSEIETTYLLQSEKMMDRLLKAKRRKEGMALDQVRRKHRI
ncbi:MAG TPA: prevent-host-death protein [Blastocatellia bacterium]|nr:prevent-host-death protein [Blastocatellia bacterium]